MMMSRGSMTSFSSSGGALRPEEQARQHTYAAERQPRRPDLALVGQDEPAEEANGGEDHRREDDQRGEEPVDHPARDRLRRDDGAVPDGDDRALDRVGGLA